MSESKQPAVCSCGATGPARGAPALAAGWHGYRSRKGPTVWVCPVCVQTRQLEAWRISDAERERRRLAVEAAQRAEDEREASPKRTEEATSQVEAQREAEAGAQRPRRFNPAMLGMMALMAFGGTR